MERSFKRCLIGALITALVLVPVMFWLDDDPPYDNVFHTIYEAGFLVVFLFAIFFVLFLGIRGLILKINPEK